MQAKMELCANCAVSMLQNISAQRENKRVAISDFCEINRSCHMSFPRIGLEQNKVFVNTTLLYVCGTGNNKCKVIWSMYHEPQLYLYGVGISTKSGDYLTGAGASIFCRNPARLHWECDSTVLHPNFSIKAGERKVILETGYAGYISWENPKLGLRLLKPKPASGTGPGWMKYFCTIVIFTPKPGLFDDNVPS
ncbi:MAG: hypothetical protein LBB21_02270 [Holosporaceae bacterium]|jgi:hypothetical protein|nr:hypothetical protein [Holosporaceae bacterium]